MGAPQARERAAQLLNHSLIRGEVGRSGGRGADRTRAEAHASDGMEASKRVRETRCRQPPKPAWKPAPAHGRLNPDGSAHISRRRSKSDQRMAPGPRGHNMQTRLRPSTPSVPLPPGRAQTTSQGQQAASRRVARAPRNVEPTRSASPVGSSQNQKGSPSERRHHIPGKGQRMLEVTQSS